MNILQINTVDTKGGAAKVAYSLKKELEKRGHKTSMLVGRKYSENSDIKLLNDTQSFLGKVRRKLAYWLANDIDVFSSDHILKTPEFKSADIVHCHNLHTNYFNLNTLEKISKIKPVVWTFHDMWPLTAHCAHAFDGALKNNGFFTCPGLDIYPPIAWNNEKYLENKKLKIYANSNFNIVTPSKWLAKKVSQSILKDKPLLVIYNGINTNIFKPLRSDLNKLRSDLGLPLNRRIVLIVAKGGASNPWKGGDYAQEIVRAFKDDPRAFFVDLGGNTRQDGPNIRTAGFVANTATLAQYYSAADILLYPSIADNCPLVVLEAMACGLPVVSFDTGGIPELIEHKINGYIAEYKDTNDLRVGVEYLLNLPSQEIEKMGQYSLNKIAAGFTIEKTAEQYINLYEKSIKKPLFGERL